LYSTQPLECRTAYAHAWCHPAEGLSAYLVSRTRPSQATPRAGSKCSTPRAGLQRSVKGVAASASGILEKRIAVGILTRGSDVASMTSLLPMVQQVRGKGVHLVVRQREGLSERHSAPDEIEDRYRQPAKNCGSLSGGGLSSTGPPTIPPLAFSTWQKAQYVANSCLPCAAVRLKHDTRLNR
jgi:hypothetical protein